MTTSLACCILATTEMLARASAKGGDVTERELYIHAGAHRTGSSSFQLMLAQNRARLREVGLIPIYPGRDGAPGGRLRLRLPGPKATPRRETILASGLASEMARQFGGRERSSQFVLSEENILGSMVHFYSGQFYPGVARRCAMLADALTAQGIARPKRVVVVLRSYADLFVSAYRKRAEDNLVQPFETIAPLMAQMQDGWPRLVARLRDGLNPATLCVVPYARRGRSVDLLAQVIGRHLDGLEEPYDLLNLSATDAALMQLQAAYRAGKTLSRNKWQEIIRQHAYDTKCRGFARFTSSQKDLMAARYAADCAVIARMPGVTLVD